MEQRDAGRAWSEKWGGMLGDLPDATIDLDRTALVVIDLQYLYHRDFGIGAKVKELGTADTQSYMHERVAELVIPNTQRLLASCRELGVRVIYTRNACVAADGSDANPKWRRRGDWNWCTEDSKEAEILEEVRPLPGEIVVNKTSSGAFNSGGFHQMVLNMGLSNLIFCGVATNYCVETSVRGAADRGFMPMLVADACAARNAVEERLAWDVLDGVYCRVLDTDDVLEVLNKAKAAA